MELAHRVPATFHCHDRSRRRVASVHAGVFVLLAIGASGAAEVNQGYPSAIVPFKAGLLLAEVEQAFENWRTAFEQQAPERLSAGCARIPAGYAASIHLRSFQNQHWLRLRQARRNMLPTLERPLYQ